MLVLMQRLWLGASDPLPEDTAALKAALIETRAKLAGAEAQSRMRTSKPRHPPLRREQVFAQSAELLDTDPYVPVVWEGRSREAPPYPEPLGFKISARLI